MEKIHGGKREGSGRKRKQCETVRISLNITSSSSEKISEICLATGFTKTKAVETMIAEFPLYRIIKTI